MTTELSPETVVELHKIASELENAPRELREDIAREHLPFLSSVMETLGALARTGDSFHRQFHASAKAGYQPMGDAILAKRPIGPHAARAARDIASQLRRHPECRAPHPPVTHYAPPVDVPSLLPFSFPQNSFTGSIA